VTSLDGFEPDWASPPGETVMDILTSRSISKQVLAERLGKSAEEVEELLCGDAPLTDELATKFSEMLGGSTRFWLTREAHYRATLDRLQAEAIESTTSRMSLREAYETERAVRDEKHPPVSDPNLCRYCGRFWQRFGATHFDGHVACAVSTEFQRWLTTTILDKGRSYASVADEMGISQNVVRAWWKITKRSGR